MSDLIWVGNTLLPRGVVIAGAIIFVLAVVGVVAAIRAVVGQVKDR